MVDFGDLIMAPLEILRRRADIAAAYHAKYRWILVDEYQDTGRVVADLLAALAVDENPPWVVGDLRQAIYRFRGADPENVARFPDDFAGAKLFDLQENYRCCPEIVAAAGQLATLMGEADPSSTESGTTWVAASDVKAVGAVPILLAHASSDAAEHAGIVEVVRSWCRSGVPAHHIAVLARRNVDVRNLALALGRAGIRASAAGVVTPDGPAGDLAAAATLADGPRASMVRVAFALGRNHTEPAAIHETVRLAINSHGDDEAASEAALALSEEVKATAAFAREERYSADAFESLTAFLFDSSSYLRRILGLGEPVRRHVLLGEVVATLGMAATYRFTHPGMRPKAARVAFAEHLRAALRRAAPSPIAPPEAEGFVRVMTCHASKGLEFPCVVVAAQTLSSAKGDYPWLPASLRPEEDEDTQQAEALLFVSVTRARQALVVSRSLSRSGGRVTRKPVSLLERWRTQFNIPTVDWIDGAVASERFELDAMWGERSCERLPAGELDPSACALRTYMKERLRLRFPTAARPLYPILIGRTRDSFRKIIEAGAKNGKRRTGPEAADVISAAWPADLYKDHPQVDLYAQAARSAVEGFLEIYDPPAEPVDLLELDLRIDGLPETPRFRLSLIAVIRDVQGRVKAIGLNFGSLADKLDRKTGSGVLWSKVTDYRRLPFVLARAEYGRDLAPFLYSIADRRFYPFRMAERNQAAIDELAGKAVARAVELGEERYLAVLHDWTCERCDVRLLCPCWADLS